VATGKSLGRQSESCCNREEEREGRQLREEAYIVRYSRVLQQVGDLSRLKVFRLLVGLQSSMNCCEVVRWKREVEGESRTAGFYGLVEQRTGLIGIPGYT
jgi:hypothetical protein